MSAGVPPVVTEPATASTTVSACLLLAVLTDLLRAACLASPNALLPPFVAAFFASTKAISLAGIRYVLSALSGSRLSGERHRPHALALPAETPEVLSERVELKDYTPSDDDLLTPPPKKS